MKILVTGATGLLGRMVMSEFRKKAFDVVGLSHNRKAPLCIQSDLTDIAGISTLLDSIQPDEVIHCAAERHPDIGEKFPEKTRLLNVNASSEIATWCANKKAHMTLISTDYVFDGKNAPYSTDAAPNPINAYGKSKFEAERTVTAATNGTAAILRVPILYGQTKDLTESAVTIIADSLLKAKTASMLKFDNISTRFPTRTEDIAVILCKMIEQGRPSGIFHWSSEEALTKYEMAVKMAEILGLSKKLEILPDNTPSLQAPRPRNTHLDTSKLKSLGISVTPTRFCELKKIFIELGF